MAGPAARTTIDPSDGRRGRIRRQARLARSDAPAVMDRLAPSQHATWQAARQRLRSDAEIAFGGDVSCGPCLLCSRSRNQSAAIPKTCRSKRAYSFLICTRTLSNSALAARAARSASRAATSAKVHCQATSGSLPSPPGCLTNISPAGSPIERRTAEALRRRSRTSAAKPGLAKYCVRSTIIVALVGMIVPCPNADADGTTGSAAAPAARCRKFRRGGFMRVTSDCMIGAPWSVDLQPERLYHRRPESNIVLETTPEFLGRRVGTGFETRIDQLLLVGRFRERRAYRLRNLLDDRLRRSRRSDWPDGRLIGQAREARLRHGRKLGRGDETLGASHCENPQLSGPMKFERLAGESHHAHNDLPADQVRHHRPRAPIGHLRELRQPRE